MVVVLEMDCSIDRIHGNIEVNLYRHKVHLASDLNAFHYDRPIRENAKTSEHEERPTS